MKNGLGLLITNYINDDGKMLYDTLVYDTRDGFSFVVICEENQATYGHIYWQGKYSSLSETLTEARKAGLDPKACHTYRGE